MLAAVLAVVPAAGPGPARAADERTVTLDGVTVRLGPETRRMVTVNHAGGYKARVTFWTEEDGAWTRRLRAADRIGYRDLVRPRRRVQGSGTTPLGTHRLPWAFGTGRQRDAWDPSYRRVRMGDHWVLDNESEHCNRSRNRSQGGFRWRLPAGHPDRSERLEDYPRQYDWAVTTGFNARQVPHRGGAIFLPVNGLGATAGCVSAPRWFMKRLMNHLDPDRAPVIAVGR